jgi:hypothetical protein
MILMLRSWHSKTVCWKFPNELFPSPENIEEYRSMYSTVVDLRNPTLRDTGIQIKILSENLFAILHLLNSLIACHIFDFKDEIFNVSAQADQNVLGRDAVVLLRSGVMPVLSVNIVWDVYL